jgi:hypothetical protein
MIFSPGAGCMPFDLAASVDPASAVIGVSLGKLSPRVYMAARRDW